jgi:hypothetical protein
MEQMTTQEIENIKILNLLMWLQVAIYASDDVEPIKWFYNKKTKHSLKTAQQAINAEHGRTIKSLWDVDGVQMPLVTETMERFTKLIAELDYYKLPEINLLLELYNDGKLDKVLNTNQKLQEHE